MFSQVTHYTCVHGICVLCCHIWCSPVPCVSWLLALYYTPESSCEWPRQLLWRPKDAVSQTVIPLDLVNLMPQHCPLVFVWSCLVSVKQSIFKGTCNNVQWVICACTLRREVNSLKTSLKYVWPRCVRQKCTCYIAKISLAQSAKDNKLGRI